MIYGDYGIGLTKEWGKNKGISPILYTHIKSPLVAKIGELLAKHSKEAETTGFP